MSSLMRRPVDGPQVSPMWLWPNPYQTFETVFEGPMTGSESGVPGLRPIQRVVAESGSLSWAECFEDFPQRIGPGPIWFRLEARKFIGARQAQAHVHGRCRSGGARIGERTRELYAGIRQNHVVAAFRLEQDLFAELFGEEMGIGAGANDQLVECNAFAGF